MTDEATLAYLVEVLALDPSEHSGQIMELRAQRAASAGRGTAANDRRRASTSDCSDARGSARAAIESARQEFWSLGADEITERLATLTVDEFPDLERARVRLLRVNGARLEMKELHDDPRMDRTLTGVLRAVLIAPGPEAARLRDDAARDSGLPYRAKRAKAFARRLKRHYPALAELEKDWLARLAQARREEKDSAAIKGGISLMGIYGLIVIVKALVRYFTDWLPGS